MLATTQKLIDHAKQYATEDATYALKTTSKIAF